MSEGHHTDQWTGADKPGLYWMKRCEQAEQRIKRLEEALPNPGRLEGLAKWFDIVRTDRADTRLQDELRAWAANIRGFRLSGNGSADENCYALFNTRPSDVELFSGHRNLVAEKEELE